jgi:hypothetical protein
MYFVSMLRAGLAANACRTVQGRAREALAPAPYFRKDRLVIMAAIMGGVSQKLCKTCETLAMFCREK